MGARSERSGCGARKTVREGNERVTGWEGYGGSGREEGRVEGSRKRSVGPAGGGRGAKVRARGWAGC